jgi:hypothetical protein
MALPWVRLDSNIATHDKVLDLLSRPNGHKAFVLWTCALGWSGGQATDGIVPRSALPINHGTSKLADLLVDVRLWEHAENGAYRIRNWDRRQETAIAREGREAMKRMSSRKANCTRWHGTDCGCWRNPESGSET